MENLEKPEPGYVQKTVDSFFRRFFSNDPNFLTSKTEEELNEMADKMIKNERLRKAVVKFFEEHKGTSTRASEKPKLLFDSEAMEGTVSSLEQIIKQKTNGTINLQLEYTPNEEW